MLEQESKSEVARLMQQIELEYEAAQRALSGLAHGTAKHEFINARVETIGRCHDELKTLVREEQATVALAQVLEQAGSEQA